jgi:hypothetical protein
MTDVLDTPSQERDAGPAGQTSSRSEHQPSRWRRALAAGGAGVGAGVRRRDLPDAPTLVGLAVAVAASGFVLAQMHPGLLVTNSTPTGGDMGAHVWAPAYLRDDLLPRLQVAGWTPDWYAGFPLYHFYMVIPPLVIVALNAGFHPVIGLPLAAAVVAATWRLIRHRPLLAPWALTVAVVVAASLVHLPYGVAFKLVSVSGVVALPVTAWAMGKLFGSPEPVPPLLALATLPFLFDTNFSIYGGNIPSTLAGEFSFAISLSLSLLAIGVAARGLDTGRHRALTAVLLALAALCHVIPAFFVAIGGVLVVALGRTTNRAWWLVLGLSAGLAPVGWSPEAGPAMRWVTLAPLAATAVLLALTDRDVRRRAAWLVPVGAVALLLAAFWKLPFLAREPFMTHMGWERFRQVGEALLTTPMQVALPVAAVGAALALAMRDRLGLLFGALALVAASATANVPDTRLWNARILPFFYLSVYLLAAVGVGLVVRAAAIALSERLDRPDRRVLMAAPVAAAVATLVAVGMPLRALPFGEVRADGTFQWLAFTSRAASFIPGWAAWNYSGYEAKPAWPEHRAIIETMAQVGADHGCGRAHWEYHEDLNAYGTPMALMLLPFWTDGCIASMEGLYFESSATTPFHFLNASAVSEAPSRPVRDLVYPEFDGGRGLGLGVEQFKVLGVRYYMAQSDAAIAAARQHPDLTERAQSPPWVVFEVAGSEVVSPLQHLPVVVDGVQIANAVEQDRFRTGWVGEAVRAFNDPALVTTVLPAEAGPGDWPRARQVSAERTRPVEPVTVSDVDLDDDRVSFRVDRTGVPVLVKVSYFPNWSVSGADGPWRAGPNLMVVVPTSEQVTLSYGRTAVEWTAMALTAAGLAALVALQRQDRRRAAPRPEAAG